MKYLTFYLTSVIFIFIFGVETSYCTTYSGSIMLSDEWADNEFLNITPDESKHCLVDVLKEYLENDTVFLEIGSGSGQHITHFAQSFPNVTFQPTDFEYPQISDINSHKKYYNLANVRDSAYLNVESPPHVWFDGDIKKNKLDYMFTANLVHATPMKITTGLFHGAALYLKPGGILFMYGPFKINGQIFGQQNIELDAKLRKANYLWGLREVFDELTGEAFKYGIYLETIHELPNHNQVLIWKKGDAESQQNEPTTLSKYYYASRPE